MKIHLGKLNLAVEKLETAAFMKWNSTGLASVSYSSILTSSTSTQCAIQPTQIICTEKVVPKESMRLSELAMVNL